MVGLKKKINFFLPEVIPLIPKPLASFLFFLFNKKGIF